jgi:ACS family tartrate transporter-like MFS transporter
MSLAVPASEEALVNTSVDFEKRTFAKIAWRLLPLLSVAYVLDYMDRNNVGFAALTMNHEIGLTASQFGTGAGILFLSYCLFEIPSNIALHKFGTRVWLARIMITWGLVSAATIFVTGPKSWYLMRFLLGFAEAGFYPGVIFYLSTWFPAEYRTRMLVLFLLAIPISTVVSAPISGLLLGMNGIAGLPGWKWLFIVEGLPVVILGVAALWLLTDHPEDAKWLTPEEKTVVRERILEERRENEVRLLLPALKDTRVILLALIQLGFTTGSYGVGIWLPQIIKTGQLSNAQIGVVTSLCYIVACVGMMIWAAQVAKSGKKIKSVALGCLLSAAGLLLAIWFRDFWVSMTWITVALVGLNASRAIFWTIPAEFLTGLAAAGGLAFINSVGTIGGFLGPYFMGVLKQRTNSFSAGLVAMAGCLIAATMMTWYLQAITARRAR